MRFHETNKFDISIQLQLEFWLEKAMNQYDEVGARDLANFVNDALYGSNNLIYNYMRSINVDYISLGGGKRAFRTLPNLLKRGVYYTDEYKEYENFLKLESERLNCGGTNMEINDDHIDYENIKW
ncbi:MAG: hypothetical protein GQ574_13340 [Crocinitomix sp.]|nr:hypothetical protein [Crocinitomix sp.]